MTPKVLLVTGSAPPDICGVGDYTASLASALERSGLQVEVLCHRRWSLAGSMEAIRRLLADRDSLVHIQYPTMGYGHSVGPQFCSLARRSIVTLHEFSLAHPLRKLSLLPFTLRSQRIVMTSEFERRSLAKKMPWADARIRVIPIGSNIEPLLAQPDICQRRVVYHGLIMPRKGIESFIDFSRLVRGKDLDWELVVIGRIPPIHEEYAKPLMELGLSYGVRWILDRSPEDVSELLSGGGLAYLPFPDGASERRGSLKSALAAGLPCITTQTEQTPDDLAKAVAVAATPQEAFGLALHLMGSREERQRLSLAALEYARNFSWDRIAQSHIELYNEVSQECRR